MNHTPSNQRMRPLNQWPTSSRAQIIGVLTDIDDTLTTDGEVAPKTLQAMHALRAAGLAVVAITGRPAGWSAGFAATWPLDALVAENGAVAFIPSRSTTDGQPAPVVRKLYQQDEPTRAANQARMQAVVRTILEAVPQARLASDSPGRECDIAIDHSEHHHLNEADIGRVAACMREAGMQATVSSIHINGWYGTHNKWQGANWIVRALFGRELAQPQELARWVYIGDSSNDVLMFEHFTHSVGVANIARFAPGMAHLPPFVTQQPRGQGFVEMVEALLAARTVHLNAPLNAVPDTLMRR